MVEGTMVMYGVVVVGVFFFGGAGGFSFLGVKANL
jgi:hypothetical protein